MALGGLLLAVGLSGMLDLVLYRVSFPLVPVSLGGGLELIAYGAGLRTRSGGMAAQSPRGPRLALLGVFMVVMRPEVRLDGSEAAYRFRYTGLRLIVRAGGRWFLLPAGWTVQRAQQFCSRTGTTCG